MAQDLRTYLDLVKRRKPGDFEIISKPVGPRFEITALVVKLEREAKRRPVLLFENVKGTRFPVLTNLHASRPRLAAAMNAAPEATQATYLRAMDKPLVPKIVPSGPVHEVVLDGDQVNLYDLPQIVHHEGDAGAYVTAAISFARNPTREIWNCAYNRLQIKGRDTTSIHLTTGKHLWEFQRIAEARNEPLPLALVIGVHPAIALGALAIGSIAGDGRGIMGGLLGEPLELVKCRTSDVLVPAHAELVLECEILPRERTPEGPFGEFTGYSLGERQREIVHVKAITHRRDAIFQDITVAHLDHMLLSTIPMEANLFRAVRRLAADRPQGLLRLSRSVAENFARRLEASSRRTPEKLALVWDGGALTFGELDRRANAFAEIVAAGGVKPGDRIALSIGNHWAFAVALIAGWKLGATVAPLDKLLKEDERADILADLSPAVLIDETHVEGSVERVPSSQRRGNPKLAAAL